MLEKSLLKPVLTGLLRLCFRVEIRGMEHYYAAGDKVVIAANHQSFLDPLLIAVFMPDKPAFAINIFQAEKWYFSWFHKLLTLYRLDPSKPLSMKHLIQDLRAGSKVVIFPEGRITTSGGIMKIYEGTGRILEKTGATLLPVHIDGAEYSKVSRLRHKLRQRWFPKIRMTILPPVRFAEGESISARAIYDVMTHAAFAASDTRRSLLQGMLDAYAWHGGHHVIASDMMRVDMNYRQLFTRAFVLKEKLAALLAPDETYVALLLPNSLGALVTFTAVQALGKVPCMLNFSSGETNILHACHIATVKTVLTSRVFIEKGKFEALIEAVGKEYKVIYLEDIRPTVTLKDKLLGLGQALFARTALQKVLERTKPDEPAVILYTSGSEGVPKGVALSHANLMANMAQATSRLDLMPRDILFNALPVFHSFGLSVGMLLPVMRGIKTFLYPSPVHYRVIPELVYDTDATVMLGTDTFYNGYAHYAHSYDFWNIRLAVAGAEKLRDATRHHYQNHFRIDILEGYGVTETSPVISFNTPLEHKTGSVGRPFPGIECRTEAVAGMERGGRLFVRGLNVMLGYLKADKPGVIQPQGEWYDTGDIVEIDAEGFITILGRAKRFAKIGGEMVSLLATEEFAATLQPDMAHAAIAIPDERKGEQIILFTEDSGLTKEHLVKHARASGVAEISLPRHVLFLEAIPRLGNGKIDYVTLAGMYRPQ